MAFKTPTWSRLPFVTRSYMGAIWFKTPTSLILESKITSSSSLEKIVAHGQCRISGTHRAHKIRLFSVAEAGLLQRLKAMAIARPSARLPYHPTIYLGCQTLKEIAQAVKAFITMAVGKKW